MEAGRVELRTLGPLQVHVGAESRVIAGKLRQRLLARLALDPQRAVAVDTLIDALWGDRPPRTAKQSLHVHVSSLRDRLREINADGLIATTENGNYRLGVGPESVDSWQFEQDVERGTQALRAKRYDLARNELERALDRWGDPFVALADYPPAIPERHRLAAIHEQACDARVDAMLAQRLFDEALPLLRATIAAEPLRERPYEQLIGLHHLVGDPVLARQVLVEARRVFHEALGIGPSDRLVDLATGAAPFELPAAEPVAASSARGGETTKVDLDVPGRWLVELPAGVDPATIDTPTGDVSVLFRTRLSSQGDALGLTPLLDFADLEAVTLTDLTLHRTTTFQRIVRGLESRGPAVLIIEDLHHASSVMADFLVWALSPSGATPALSFVGMHHGDLEAEVIVRLRSRCQTSSLDSALARSDVGDPQDPDEAEVLDLLRHAVRPVPSAVIARASTLAAESTDQAMRRLAARGVMIDRPGGRLDLVGSRSAASTSAERDLALADTIAECFGHDDPYRIVAEAHHRLRALPEGDADQAWTSALAAAERFDTLDSYDELVLLGGLAPPFVRSEDPAELSPSQLRFRSFVGRARIRLGDPVGGENQLREVIDVATDADVFAEAVRFVIERTTPQLQPESRDLVVRALDALGPEATDDRVQLLSNLSGMWFLVDADRSLELSEDCLETAHRSKRPDSIATALNGHVQAHMLPGNAATRLELALEAQQYARRANSIESLCLALTYEAQALVELGRLERAEAPLVYATALADQIQIPRFCWWADAWTALLSFARGDIDCAEANFIAAHDRWPGSRDPVQCLGVQLATLWLFQGRGGDLLPMLEHYDTEGTDVAIAAARAFAYAQAGRADEARALIARQLEPGQLDGVRDISQAYALAMTAEAAYLVDADFAGPPLAELITPMADTHVALNVWGGGGCYWGSLQHGLGLAQALAGDPSASATLTAAAAANADAGATAFAQRSQQIAARH